MFGYVRPQKDEMKVRDWNLWQKNYCGLCRCLGKRHGFAARFLLSYDMTFLYSLFTMGEKEITVQKCWCPAGVVCRKPCRTEDEAMQYTADLTVLLMWWKLRDDEKDGSLLRKIGAGLLRFLYRRAARRAAAARPETDRLIREQLLRLSALEKECSSSIDQTADAFAQILKGCADYWQEAGQRRAAEQLLYHIGRFVYLADALDDLAEDCKKDRYNPLRYRFSPENGKLLPEDQQSLLQTMDASLDQASAAFELLERSRAGAVPENVIYYGLPSVMKAVAAGRFHARKKKVTV
ncbi:MAG: hypothetical protein IJP11_08545 [Oscillospiraceae bacterium]|nr:hypothetical protein [Oscillospiraceae bacterium]